jgi:hypothetical protein
MIVFFTIVLVLSVGARFNQAYKAKKPEVSVKFLVGFGLSCYALKPINRVITAKPQKGKVQKIVHAPKVVKESVSLILLKLGMSQIELEGLGQSFIQRTVKARELQPTQLRA